MVSFGNASIEILCAALNSAVQPNRRRLNSSSKARPDFRIGSYLTCPAPLALLSSSCVHKPFESAFHPVAQQDVSLHDAHEQSRLFAPRNQRLRHSPNVPAASVKHAAQPEALFAAVKSLDNVLVQINVAEEISLLVNFH